MTVSPSARYGLLVLSALTGPCAGAAQSPARTRAIEPLTHPVYPGGDATPLGTRIAILLKDPAVARAHWGIAVTAMNGTPVYGLEEGKLFRPASTAKLFTTAAAMALLGPSSHVDTFFVTANQRKENVSADGILEGDLVLEGGGDASLGSLDVPYREPALDDQGDPVPSKNDDPLLTISTLFADLGVQRITGDIVGDDSRWPLDPLPATWSIGDEAADYGAPVSALTLHDNLLHLEVTVPEKADAPMTETLSPSLARYHVETKLTAATANQSPPQSPAQWPAQSPALRVERRPGSDLITLTGSLKAGQIFTADLPVDDPALFAAETVKALLEAQGVQVEGHARAQHGAPVANTSIRTSREPLPALPLVVQTPVGSRSACISPCRILADWPSPTLAEEVKATLKESLNLHAEILLRRLGEAFGATGSSEEGVRVERQWLRSAGLDAEDFVFLDGSGLSSQDLVTPRAEASLLAFAPTQPWFSQWKAALPVGGVDGTLLHRFTEGPLKGHVFAKTGTLGESRALAGYVHCRGGREVIFSIMVDDHEPGSPADRLVMDGIVAAIATLE